MGKQGTIDHTHTHSLYEIVRGGGVVEGEKEKNVGHLTRIN